MAHDEGAAADMALNETLGFELGIGVGDGGAVNAKDLGEFPTGRNAVAGAKVTRVNQGAELIPELNIERYVAFGLKVYWQHCLSPSGYFSRNWTGERAKLSLEDRSGALVALIELGGWPLNEGRGDSNKAG
jgi:hypothetical protein